MGAHDDTPRPWSESTLGARLTDVEKTIKSARRALVATVALLAGGAGTVASGVLSASETRGGDRMRLQQLERNDERLEAEIRELRLQLGRMPGLDRAGWLVPPTITSKGHQP